MPIFNYVAKDIHAKTIGGTLEASDSAKASELLLSNSLTPVSITPVHVGSKFKIPFLFNRVSQKQLMVFTRQISTMVGAGLPLTQTLKTLEMQTENATLKSIVKTLTIDIESGSPMSVGLEKFPRYFSPIYINLVRAGEASGKLDTVMLKLADQVERSYEFKQKVRTALVYPVLVIITMAIVVTGLLVFVVPQMKTIYESFNAELPYQTKFIIAVSDFLSQKFWVLGILIAIFIFGYKKFKKSPTGEQFLAKLSLRMPITGKVRQGVDITEFSRTLGLLVASGVPILQSLEISSESVSNTLLKNDIKNAARQVEKGISIAQALSVTTNFPPMLTQMISVGEQTGKLDEVLKKVSDSLERDTDTSVKNLTTAIEPIILVVLGAVVGFLVLSMILPIYNLTSTIG